MNDFVVYNKLTASIIDDQDTDTATAVGKRVVQSRPQSTLINDWKTLLDIASLSHGNNTAIIAHIKDTVLLEDGAEHVLDDDRWRRIGNKAGFFMELLSEEVHSEIAVLASLNWRSDANNLTGTALQNQEVANTDVVAWNGDGLGVTTTALNIANSLMHSFADARWATLTMMMILLNNHLLALVLGGEGVEDTVRGLLKTVAKRVVVTFVVVISHAWSMWGVYCFFGFDAFFAGVMVASAFELDVVGWVWAATVFTLSDINFFLVARDFDVDLGICVTAVRVLIAIRIPTLASPEKGWS